MANEKKYSQDELQDAINRAVIAATEHIAKKSGEDMQAAMMASAKISADILAAALKPKDKAIEKYEAMEHCPKCWQLKRACKEEHVKMVVAPKNRRRMKDFPGLFLNGVQYISSDGQTAIHVPKHNDFDHQLHVWEEAEEDLRTGRSLDWNSGTLSAFGNKTNIRQANPLGFRGFAP